MSKKILVVDDEVDMVEMVEARLVSNGYEVIKSFDGLDALRKVESEKPDLMILDVMMPKLDGFSVAKMVRDSELVDDKAHLPIIILTAKSSAKEETAGFASGTNVYIRKPFEPEELLAAVKKLLGEASVS